jgi:hypothetical protein
VVDYYRIEFPPQDTKARSGRNIIYSGTSVLFLHLLDAPDIVDGKPFLLLFDLERITCCSCSFVIVGTVFAFNDIPVTFTPEIQREVQEDHAFLSLEIAKWSAPSFIRYINERSSYQQQQQVQLLIMSAFL